MTELLSRDQDTLIAQAKYCYELMSDEARCEFEETLNIGGPSPALIAALFLCIGLVIGFLGS